MAGPSSKAEGGRRAELDYDKVLIAGSRTPIRAPGRIADGNKHFADSLDRLADSQRLVKRLRSAQ